MIYSFIIIFTIFLTYSFIWLYFSQKYQSRLFLNQMSFLGYGFIAVTSFFIFNTKTTLAFVVTVLVMLWSIYNATKPYIFKKVYPQLKISEYKNYYSPQVFFVYYLLLIFMSIPVILINSWTNISFSFVHSFSLLIILTGFIYLIFADIQLALFKSKHPKSLQDRGLRSFSRYPNIFGMILFYFGIFLLLWHNNLWILALVSPIYFFIYIFKLDGVNYLDEKLKNLTNFTSWKSKTNALIPMIQTKKEIYLLFLILCIFCTLLTYLLLALVINIFLN